MSAAGVIPQPEDRRPRYTQTGEMDAGDAHVVFAAEGDHVILLADGADIVLGPNDQDLFVRRLFRAINAAEIHTPGPVPW